MLWIPRPVRRSLALGPTPLIFFAASGQMRVAICSGARIVTPFGLSRSEQIFESSLFGLMPIEQAAPQRRGQCQGQGAGAIAGADQPRGRVQNLGDI